MPQSLLRTWAALALASLAVLVVALLVGRDFVRDVYPVCPGSTELQDLSLEEAPGPLVPVYFDTDPTAAILSGEHPSFQLLFDERHDRGLYSSTRYDNVRIVWKVLDGDGIPATAGSIPLALSGEMPSDLHLFREEGSGRYIVKGRGSGTNDLRNALPSIRAAFRITKTPARHLQTDRIFTMHHLPTLVVLFALGALGVALLRSRRAMSYALRIHKWTEATLTEDGVIESETGATLATLEQSRAGRVPPGAILVAPKSLSTSGLYRDMPIVSQRNVAEGSHARWASGTMLRLRDARALAVVSTMCTVLAFGARLIA